MLDIRKNRFLDCLDTIQLISRPAIEDLGEDSFFCSKCQRSAIVSVFDGCGGLGAMKYPSCGDHTGAYIASRTVSGAVCDWYHANYRKNWGSVEKLSRSINNQIMKAYENCKLFLKEKSRVSGSMVRELPTTMALAYAEMGKDGILIHILWAGDSRIYLLDAKGLAQLTLDDAYVEDALENLRKDSPLTNVLSADGVYEIHCKTICVREPVLIFAATDWCYGYLETPMDFEYLLLKSMWSGETPEKFRRLLRKTLGQYAGDDLTMGFFSFFLGDYNKTKELFRERLLYLEEKYIRVLDNEKTEECARRLWITYKPEYERYLHVH